MSPKITDGSEFRLNIDRKRHTLLVRGLTPRSANADFVVSSGGVRQDQGVMSTNSGAGISESEFYAGKSTITGARPSQNVYLKASKDRPVVLVQLED